MYVVADLGQVVVLLLDGLPLVLRCLLLGLSDKTNKQTNKQTTSKTCATHTICMHIIIIMYVWITDKVVYGCEQFNCQTFCLPNT